MVVVVRSKEESAEAGGLYMAGKYGHVWLQSPYVSLLFVGRAVQVGTLRLDPILSKPLSVSIFSARPAIVLAMQMVVNPSNKRDFYF